MQATNVRYFKSSACVCARARVRVCVFCFFEGVVKAATLQQGFLLSTGSIIRRHKICTYLIKWIDSKDCNFIIRHCIKPHLADVYPGIVVCLSCLLHIFKTFAMLANTQPCSDCSHGSSLIWVPFVCNIGNKVHKQMR